MARKKLRGCAAEPDVRQLTLDILYGERVSDIPLEELHEPDTQPFLVRDDEAMNALVESVSRYGVREPGLARPRVDGGYELLCGNRRKRACQVIGLATLPVIVRDMDDQSAVVTMVDSNLMQREKLLYSEKAWAYRVKMEALNHKGSKSDAGHSVEIINRQTGYNKSFIFRLIRLTELVDVLLDKVDANKLAFSTGVEISYLSYDEQFIVADAMERLGVKPSLSQAVRLKKLSKDSGLTAKLIESILAEPKESPVGEKVTRLKYRRYFPPDYSPKQIETIITGLLANWKAGVII